MYSQRHGICVCTCSAPSHFSLHSKIRTHSAHISLSVCLPILLMFVSLYCSHTSTHLAKCISMNLQYEKVLILFSFIFSSYFPFNSAHSFLFILLIVPFCCSTHIILHGRTVSKKKNVYLYRTPLTHVAGNV